MNRKSLALIAALCAVAIPLAFAACGSSDETTTTAASDTTEQATTDESTSGETSAAGTGAASGPGGTVDISETEYKLDPSDPAVKSGKVTFAINERRHHRPQPRDRGQRGRRDLRRHPEPARAPT